MSNISEKLISTTKVQCKDYDFNSRSSTFVFANCFCNDCNSIKDQFRLIWPWRCWVKRLYWEIMMHWNFFYFGIFSSWSQTSSVLVGRIPRLATALAYFLRKLWLCAPQSCSCSSSSPPMATSLHAHLKLLNLWIFIYLVYIYYHFWGIIQTRAVYQNSVFRTNRFQDWQYCYCSQYNYAHYKIL